MLTDGDSVGGNRIGGSYGPAPQPFGSNGILVVFPGCRIVGGLTNPCNYNKNAMRSDPLLWQEVGTTVTGPQVLQAAVSGQTINDSASLVVRGQQSLHPVQRMDGELLPVPHVRAGGNRHLTGPSGQNERPK